MLDEFCQRSELAGIYKVELINEVDEVLKAGVQVGLSSQEHYVLEVGVVYVGIHAEQSLKNNLNYVHKVLREWNTQGTREDLLIIELVLNPGHQEVNVLTGTDLQWGLDVVAVCPEVFVLGASTHGWTRLSCAELHENSVEDVNLIVELNSVHSQPFVQVFTCWQLDGQLHVAGAQCHTSNLLKLIATCAFLDLLFWLVTFGFVKTSDNLIFLFFHHVLLFYSF